MGGRRTGISGGLATRAAPAGGTTILSGTLAARPAAGVANRYYWATDVQMLYRDNGVLWQAIAHGNLEAVSFQQHHNHYVKYLKCMFTAYAEQVYGTGAVKLMPVEVEHTVTIDRLIAFGVAGTTPGNFRLGIYGSVGNVPDGGALLAETASVAVGDQMNEVAMGVASLTLTPGLYFFAEQNDNGSLQLVAPDAHMTINGSVQCRSYAQAYGAFANPCPATGLETQPPLMWGRVLSIP
jgi:hypothetical protein